MHVEPCIVCYMLAWGIYSFAAYIGSVKIVLSLFSYKSQSELIESGPDLLELRLDKWVGDPVQFIREKKGHETLSKIITVRSEEEGGFFKGTPEEWEEMVNPILPYADYIDIEQKYSRFAEAIRAKGKKVIASYHSYSMVHTPQLRALEANVRRYGDIPKIIVTPESHDDVFSLIQYLISSTSPICLGVMGEEFRYARALFALFGSFFVYCHGGTATAKGQYSVGEMKKILNLLRN